MTAALPHRMAFKAAHPAHAIAGAGESTPPHALRLRQPGGGQHQQGDAAGARAVQAHQLKLEQRVEVRAAPVVAAAPVEQER